MALAWAKAELDDVAEAAQVVKQALTRLYADTYRRALANALRVHALVAARQGCWGMATEALEEGLALAQAMPYPYAAARLLQVAGVLHAQQGEPGLARERLEAALALFRQLGADKDTDQAQQAIVDLQ